MSTPTPPNPRSQFTPKSAEIPLADRPLSHALLLPDHTPLFVEENQAFDLIQVGLGARQAGIAALGSHAHGNGSAHGAANGTNGHAASAIAQWKRNTAEQQRVSLHGVVQDQRAVSEDVWQLSLGGALSTADRDDVVRAVWAAVYAFWLRRDPYERLPIQVTASDSDDAAKLALAYLTQTGLAFRPVDAKSPAHLLLVRASFYQGAGAPLSLWWLRSPDPSPAQFGPLASSSFPPILAFTKRSDPPVLTTHPLRPAKPSPGTVVYSRWIPSVGELLELTHIDAGNPAHFEAYARWQNSDRVNVGWREKGNEEHHRRYLLESLADPHKMGYVVSWNGQLAGYGEANWNKEDGMAAFVGGCGEYDQGTHLLIGEERFRGRHRLTSIMVSMKHMCFLREPRTDVVIGEPRYDLPIIPLLKNYLPQDLVKEVELPHKRAVFFVLKRERFFLEGQFY